MQTHASHLRSRPLTTAITEIWFRVITLLFKVFQGKTALLLSAQKNSPKGCSHYFLFNVGPQPPGYLTAHEAIHLPLLPSGPDGVHETPLRKTKALRSDLEKEQIQK